MMILTNHTRRLRWTVCACIIGGSALSAAPARADGSVKDLLADTFTDPSFGFSMRPPVNCHIDRQKKTADHGGYQLVQFDNIDFVWTVNVFVYRLNQPIAPSDLLRGVQRESLRQYPNRTILDRSLRTIAARVGGYIVTQYVDEAGRALVRQEAVIPFDREQFFKVQMTAGQHDIDTVRPLFLAMLDSFEFVHSELTHRELDDALARGAALLRECRLTSIHANLVPEATMLIRIDGEDVGYATITEAAERRDGVDGVFVREKGWVFLSNGSIDRINNAYFASNDLQSGTFELRLQRYVPPAPGGKPPEIIEQLDTGMREHDKLVLAYSQQSGDAALTNEVLVVPPAYLPMVAHRLISRIIPLDRAELYAFATYSTIDRNLVLHTVRVQPREAVSRNMGPTVQYELLDGEGMVPPYAEVYCDGRGRIVRVESEGRSFIQSSPTTVNQLFAARVKEAEARFAQLLGERKTADQKK